MPATAAKDRQSFTEGQYGEFRLVACEHYQLAMFFAEAMGDMAKAAPASVYTITVTSEQAPCPL
jgi:hypothetical protein